MLRLLRRRPHDPAADYAAVLERVRLDTRARHAEGFVPRPDLLERQVRKTLRNVVLEAALLTVVALIISGLVALAWSALMGAG